MKKYLGLFLILGLLLASCAGPVDPGMVESRCVSVPNILGNFLKLGTSQAKSFWDLFRKDSYSGQTIQVGGVTISQLKKGAEIFALFDKPCKITICTWDGKNGYGCYEIIGKIGEKFSCGNWDWWKFGNCTRGTGQDGDDDGQITVEDVNLGFIGWYLDSEGTPRQTSFYWQKLGQDDMLDWEAIDAAYDSWVAQGGLPPNRENGWQTSGVDSNVFADYADIGFADFGKGQLENYSKAFFVDPGYVLDTVKATYQIEFIGFMKMGDGQIWTNNFYHQTIEEGASIRWSEVEAAYAALEASGGGYGLAGLKGWRTSGIDSSYFDEQRPDIVFTSGLTGWTEGVTKNITFSPDCNASQIKTQYHQLNFEYVESGVGQTYGSVKETYGAPDVSAASYIVLEPGYDYEIVGREPHPGIVAIGATYDVSIPIITTTFGPRLSFQSAIAKDTRRAGTYTIKGYYPAGSELAGELAVTIIIEVGPSAFDLARITALVHP